MRAHVFTLTLLLALGCGEEATPVSIEPEPAEVETAPTPAPAEPSPREVADAVREQLQVAGLHPTVPLRFESEEADAATYDALARVIARSPRVTRIRIGVHSDPRGSAEWNRRLTLERARAAATALVARGVACERLEPTGFGEDAPLADAPLEAQRRVELTILRVDDLDLVPDDVEGPDACP